MNRFSSTLLALTATLACVLGAAACGGTPITTTPTPSPTAGSPTAGDESAGIPLYEPSVEVSQAGGSTVLRTADSVEQVRRFYADALAGGGWQVVSQTGGQDFASFVVKRSGQGASITIAPGAEAQTLITISTYPSP